MYAIDITIEHDRFAVDENRLREAVRAILTEEGIASATISVAVVDDATIHNINREFLSHDYSTDVISFVLGEDGGHLDGEIVISADTAIASAGCFGWAAEHELLLYAIHGALHLVGYDDLSEQTLTEMRARERHYLAYFGLQPRYDDMRETTTAETVAAGESAS